MIWWLQDPKRLLSEVASVNALSQEVDWLRDVTRRVEDMVFSIDFDIVDGASTWHLTLTYPPFFPNIPPQVFNADGVRISGHQYGTAGELCLEFRPDNWDPSITGAQMIESAHRLLVGESVVHGGEGVASAHSLTTGQRLRQTMWRLLLPREALDPLMGLEAWQQTPISVSEYFYAGAGLAHLTGVGPVEDRTWAQLVQVPGSAAYQGIAIKLPRDIPLSGPVDTNLLALILISAGISSPSPTSDPTVYLLVGESMAYLAMTTFSKEGEETHWAYDTIVFEPSSPRLPVENLLLWDKPIGIVGCGSLGSKIAAMLVRSGCRRIHLFDADVLEPGNLVRNELDWRSVGAHKVRGLKARLLEIAPDTDVQETIVHLGGQESSGWTGAAMQKLAGCAVIVDATADPLVFGLCAAAARYGRRPMVWAEVFAGGYGGLVARARPDHDPSPDIARQQILGWCEEQNVPPPIGTSTDYALARDEQPAMVADDADVTTIAGHTARMILDTLKQGSQFPYPAYFIGLAESWTFTQPFDVRPVSYSGSDGWKKEMSGDSESLARVAALLFDTDESEAESAPSASE